MSKRTTIRIPDDVYNQISERAKVEQRTISNLIILLLKQSLNVATSVARTERNEAAPHQNAE